jgi:transcriptional regulator with GAF, ATPase, and Fis domain
MDARSLDAIARRLDPQSILEDLCAALGGAAPFDRAGIAVARRDASEFHIPALADRSRVVPHPASRRFPMAHTVSSWVLRFGIPFVGTSLEDVRAHRQTHGSMVRDAFGSNLVLPLDVGEHGLGTMFLLARGPGAFNEATMPICFRVRDVLAPILNATLATRALQSGSALPAPDHDDRDRPLTLRELERQHIERVLAETDGVIEGPAGAAAILGLKPSTLRHRIARLGASRHPGA